MATYTQLNQQEIQKLADNYQLTVAEFEPMEGGNGNSSHLMKTETSTYVLTVCDDKVYDEVFKMGQLLLLLEEHDVPCTRLISTVNSEILTTHSDKPVMLKAYIEGQVLDSLNETMLTQVGMQAARLNQISAPTYLPTNHPYGSQLFSKVIGLNIDEKYEVWLAKEVTYLDNNISDRLPLGLIHGDLFNDNLLFENGNFKAIIDFEEACYYYNVFELGMAIVGSCLNDTSINFDKASALVSGYQQVRPLEDIEKDSLQMFVRYAATATSYWRFNKYNIEMPSKDKADHHWKMVQVSEDVSAISKAKFLNGIFK
ncbi:homoserine kinase [Colwellia piezophila]|uniref:homoserine kinase n=1 Tax=Colwellia piezophila TaxID=211668 RepID=UPI0003778D82|nr:homoserine kinase [Colwellia piezophila]